MSQEQVQQVQPGWDCGQHEEDQHPAHFQGVRLRVQVPRIPGGQLRAALINCECYLPGYTAVFLTLAIMPNMAGQNRTIRLTSQVEVSRRKELFKFFLFSDHRQHQLVGDCSAGALLHCAPQLRVHLKPHSERAQHLHLLQT